MTLRARAEAWLAEDPDPDTRAQLQAILDDESQLADCFAQRLTFGTAGLRGALGPGPNRMNRVVVTQAAAGLAAYLTASHPHGCAVVIGYDARHNSEAFARDTAEVLTGAGISVMVFPTPCPTPVLAYAIRRLGCAAGVMVTASHNPPQDNGYKVYLGDGCQIIPPADAEIEAEIARIAQLPLADIPRGEEWDTLGEGITDDYIRRAASLISPKAARDISIIYTPLHGVGGDVLTRLFATVGFGPLTTVAAQFDPDPDFPTVTFPNPEEPGALDLALAQSSGADIIIANDPDADRCALAAQDRTGTWRMLRGDELGSLLAWWITQRAQPAERRVLAQSIVSCSLLARIAEANGYDYARTLTGFKWIGRLPGLAYGYEEALGYCVDPEAVADKDGITAALLTAEMCAHLKFHGMNVDDVLDDLALTYGLYATDQVSVRVSDRARIPEIVAALRSNPPLTIAGTRVTSFLDLESPDSDLPPTDGLLFELEGNARVIIRPSGTEPKVKCYLQTVVHVTGSLEAARAQAGEQLHALAEAVRTWLD
ncbi:MAG: phospho-sugar mutase [Actinobacteria bacterium]|nr:phospho-sugar mutase [Actinomycetota bacterium]